jgi:IPT/TIG domain
MTLLCITRQSSSPGTYDVEISVNGRDYIATGFVFEYLSLLPISSSPDPVYLAPLIFDINPNVIPSSGSQIIHVYGANYLMGSYCLSSNNNIKAIISQMISSTELECILPMHIPGMDEIIVINPDGHSSAGYIIEFSVSIPAVHPINGITVSPTNGPRQGGTVIVIYGMNFHEIDKTLKCLINDVWSYAVEIRPYSVTCTTPPASFSGIVPVYIGTIDKELFSGYAEFEYIEDPVIYNGNPYYGTVGTELLIQGIGFAKFNSLSCAFADSVVLGTIVSNTILLCTVPLLNYPGTYSITIATNNQHYIRSGVEFAYFKQSELVSLWPVNGPAMKGSTIVTIYGSDFPVDNTIDIWCLFGSVKVPAIVTSDEVIKCRTSPQRIGIVNVSVIADGTFLHSPMNNLQFMFVADVSVVNIVPNAGYNGGGYPVFIYGNNFINTTSLGCRFGDMLSRGIFLTSTAMLCISPSTIGRSLYKSTYVTVEATVNGFDYSESGILFNTANLVLRAISVVV